MNRTKFCFKFVFFTANEEATLKTKQPIRFQGLLKITNQIAGNSYSPPPQKKMDEFNFKPAYDFKSNSRWALVRFWNHAYDFSPNCTPLSSITVINLSTLSCFIFKLYLHFASILTRSFLNYFFVPSIYSKLSFQGRLKLLQLSNWSKSPGDAF